MKQGRGFFIGATIAVVLALALALLAAGGQGAQAQATIIYVDADAIAGGNNGSSWVNAYTDLQDALDAAGMGDQIWVAEGTYRPSEPHGGTGDRFKSFQMLNNVDIYGGFDPSVGVTIMGERDWAIHQTILSGDIGLANDSSDNCYHVFYHPAGASLDSSAILDGFVIAAGSADASDWPHSRDGGGMYNDNSSPTLRNVIFAGNSAIGYGGGMLNANSSPALTGCTFDGNSAAQEGGGIFNAGGSTPVLNTCAFVENSAYDGGGGMANDASSPALTNCTFWNNLASGIYGSGGGMLNTNGSAPVLVNCTFSENHYSIFGSGGGMANSASTPTLTNCILWGDSNPEIYNSGSSPVITYSDVEGGHIGTGNIDVDPLFVGAYYGNLHLGSGSPCIDAGTNTSAPAVDYEGDPRPQDGDDDGTAIVDMGADEAPLYVDVSIDPNSGSNTHYIRKAGNRELPVAILATEAFDVARVVIDSVLFEGASAISFEYEDVDDDDDLDLLLVFKVKDMVELDDGDTWLVLTGVVDEGTLIQGTVELVGKPGRGPQ